MASSVGNGCGRLWVVCCVRVSMGWGTSFGSNLWHALNLCLSCCYVTRRVTPFAQTHPVYSCLRLQGQLAGEVWGASPGFSGGEGLGTGGGGRQGRDDGTRACTGAARPSSMGPRHGAWA